MKIIYLDEVGSTQIYIKELVASKMSDLPIAVVALRQTDGVGSRDNRWNSKDGNLFFSFALPLSLLPSDLPLQSASIYFAFLMKESLRFFGSQAVIKWPNDLYCCGKKIGGVITNLADSVFVCGIGVNMISADEDFGVLDSVVSRDELLSQFFSMLDKKYSWKQVFSMYELEFYENNSFFTNYKNLRISLKNVSLQSDGSIVSDGERIYGLR